MTDWLWILLAFEAVGWGMVALTRNTVVLYLTTAVLLGALIFQYDLPNDPHLYFAVMALALHTLFYVAVASLVLWIARRMWPRRSTPTVK
ncbi:MAG TPA: hypothetical protein VM915_13395 [Verrucomicrobiae bacterium]|nr:hypothetical protein [Verrucomicrobiae bacterium]